MELYRQVKIYIVSVAAVPYDKLNAMAMKVVGAAFKKPVAETMLAMHQEKKEDLVYGIKCKLYSSISEMQIADGFKGSEIYAIVATAIPVEQGKDPVQASIHSIYTSRKEIEDSAKKLMEKNEVVVKGIKCHLHVSMMPVRVV